MRFPMNTYKSEGTSWVKLNVTASLIWVSFFQIAISLLAYVATFSGQLYFGRSYFFTLFQSNYFDTTVTFSGQLFLQNSCFFLLFQNSYLLYQLPFQKSYFFTTYFFRGVTISQLWLLSAVTLFIYLLVIK